MADLRGQHSPRHRHQPRQQALQTSAIHSIADQLLEGGPSQDPNPMEVAVVALRKAEPLQPASLPASSE